jgi:hypothetical protein
MAKRGLSGNRVQRELTEGKGRELIQMQRELLQVGKILI